MANKLLLLMVLFLGHVVALENSTVKRMTSMSQQLFAGTAGLLRGDPQHSSSRWKMVIFASLCASLPGIWFLRKRFRGKQSEEVRELMSGKPSLVNEDAEDEGVDPGLLKKHSENKSYSTSRFTYPSLRVFFRQHPQANKLPTTPSPIPLFVFIHGLGGSVAQFHPLLTSLVNLSSCLAIDLPGCGLSEFAPTAWEAYKFEALVELLAVVIEDYRDKELQQGVVLIGHSMGCSLSAQLASRVSTPSADLAKHIVGLIAICPKADPPSKSQVATFRKLLAIPGPIFDVWRQWDRKGGTESKSVRRFVGDADLETRKLQVRFNEQSRTPVWRRMASGSLPIYEGDIAKGGLPGQAVWEGLDVPVFLISGEADHITTPAELEKIAVYLGKSHPGAVDIDKLSEPITDSAAPVDSSMSRITDLKEPKMDSNKVETSVADIPQDSEDVYEDPSTPHEESADIPIQPARPKKVLKTTILPAPANHAMLYMPATVRTLAGLISDFLCAHVSQRLSLGWQLQFLSTAGKWDVKNLAKWQAVTPVSEPIAGIFRAMKTLREVDEEHCPEIFVKTWGAQIRDIVDISHESPVYDPRGLENGGVLYHKLPTVSKIPPTSSEVKEFIALIDRLREKQIERRQEEHWIEEPFIGVHCHYGFNRTGYFIVCYLIERCGYSVGRALNEFAEKRPKGIKHAHFMDQLYVRYCVGLKRAPTL